MRTRLIILIPALAAGFFFGCKKHKEPTRVLASSAADQTYVVRGIVDALPTGDGKQSLSVHHEAIADFKGRDGAVVGMKEMIMPFPDLGEGVTPAGLAIGDRIEMTFEVRWNTPPRTKVVKLIKLPADTALNLQTTQSAGPR